MSKLLEKERWLTRLLWNFCFLVIGVTLYLLGFFKVSEQWAEPLSSLGQIIAGGSILFFIFSWTSERHLYSLAQTTVGNSIETVLKGKFGGISARIMNECINDYRWRCFIGFPDSKDPYPSYVYQKIYLSYYHPFIPKQFMLLIGFSNENDATKAYFENKKCLLRWPMSYLEDEKLDLSNNATHGILNVKIDGKPIGLKRTKSVKIGGGEAKEYWYSVPTHLQGKDKFFELSFFIRKIKSMDNILNVITRVFEDVNDAEFILKFDRNTPVDSMVIHDEAVPLFNNKGFMSLTIDKYPDGLVEQGMARYGHIIQKGSNIRFEARLKQN